MSNSILPNSDPSNNRHNRRPKSNLAGRRYGRLLVLYFYGRNPHHHALWACQCDCGEYCTVRAGSLTNGTSKSCGCLRDEIRHIGKHGETRNGMVSPEYTAYLSAKARVKGNSDRTRVDYADRGIEFRFNSFEQFLAEVGRRPSRKHSLDRYPDNDGHYEPGNVRWATRSEQQTNKRTTRYLTHNLQSLTPTQWDDVKGWKRGTISARRGRGWCDHCTINIPYPRGGTCEHNF